MGANANNALFFLVTTLFELYLGAVLLRIILAWVRADFYNPVSQLVVKVTEPVLAQALGTRIALAENVREGLDLAPQLTRDLADAAGVHAVLDAHVSLPWWPRGPRVRSAPQPRQVRSGRTWGALPPSPGRCQERCAHHCRSRSWAASAPIGPSSRRTWSR